MQGYTESSYGDGFADVYDDWYPVISDVAATTDVLRELAAGGRALELGVGTGRLAIPLARTGVEVHGLDSSELMLQRMEAKPGGDAVRRHVGDMVDDIPEVPFALVFAAYNTFFSLLTPERQQACFHQVARRLVPDGAFVIEAFVPDAQHEPTSAVAVRSVTVDRVVLSVSSSDPTAQRAEGQYVDITQAGGVRLRPWSIRWSTPSQLDSMAATAGFRLRARWESFARDPFSDDSARHVSVFVKEGV